jgi:LysM repeat protein
MDMSRAALSAMAKDIKVDLSKPLSPEDEKKLVTRFRGLPPEPAYAKAYEKGVNIPKPQKSTQQKPVEQKPQTQVQPQTQQTKEPTSDYEVKSGDSLSKIAKQYNKTVDEIIKLNPDIKNPDRIKPGQKIKTK